MAPDDKWANNAIKAVRDYGKNVDRNPGEGSTLKWPRGKMTRGPRGGLMYAPATRSQRRSPRPPGKLTAGGLAEPDARIAAQPPGIYQLGFRFSRNAVVPSWPSGEYRCVQPSCDSIAT